MDYSYLYDYGYSDADVVGAALGIFGVIFLIAAAVGIFMIVTNWKIFQKAGKPGWASIVPFYSQYVLAEITWGNGWFFLISFAAVIPFVGSIAVLVFTIMTYIKLAKAFGKDGGFAVGLIFLNPIFLAILAFGKSEYVGVDTNINPFSNNNQNNNQNNNNNQYNNFNNNGNYNQNNMNYNNNNYQNNFQNNNQNNGMMNTNNNNVVNNNQNNDYSGQRFCTNCGTKLENNALFCTNCGSKVN